MEDEVKRLQDEVRKLQSIVLELPRWLISILEDHPKAKEAAKELVILMKAEVGRRMEGKASIVEVFMLRKCFRHGLGNGGFKDEEGETGCLFCEGGVD
jgi:hypothetical protein